MRYLVAALGALIGSTAFGAEPPLPAGAVARLGTTAFRTNGNTITLSPDGTRAAFRVREGIDVMNLATGEIVARVRDEKRLRDPKHTRGPHWFTFAFASGGKELVTAHIETEVHVWDATTGKYLRSVGGLQTFDKKPAHISTVFNAPLADFVICETWAGWQKLDVKTGKWTPIKGGYDRISAVSPDGRWVTDYTDMASVENYVGVTDTKLSKGVYNGESGGAYPFNSVPSPDGKLVACSTGEAGPQVWEVATKKELKLKDADGKTYAGPVRFAPDNKTLLMCLPASIYDEKTPPHFARWDVTTGARLKDWPMPMRVAQWAVDHPRNRLVLTMGQGVYTLDLATGKLAAPPDGFAGVTRAAVSPDGKFAAVGDGVGAIRVWDAPFTGKPRALRAEGDTVDDITFSADSKTLFAGHADRSVSVWNPATGKQTAILNSPTDRAANLPWHRRTIIAVSPDGKTVIAVADTQALWAWDVPTAKVLWREASAGDGHKSTIPGCRPAFTADSAALYFGRSKGEVSKLDPRTGKELARLKLPFELKSWGTRLALSPDGKKLAVHTYYNDGELLLYDIAKGEADWRQKFKLEEAVGEVAFTPDGAAVLTTHIDGTIREWAARDGARTTPFRGPGGTTFGLQLTADGKHAITDAPGATALVWKRK